MRIKNQRQQWRLHAMRSVLSGEGDGGGSGGDDGGGGGDAGAGGDVGGGDAAKPQTLSALLGDNELTKDPSLVNYLEGDVASLAKGYVSAQKMIGADPNSVLKLPTGTGDEHKAAWGEVYAKLGRPEDSKGYEIPEALAAKREEFGLSDELVGQFADRAHSMGLSKAQFGDVMGFYGELLEGGAGEMAAAEEAKTKAQEEQVNALKSEWGAEYENNVGIALDGIKALGDDVEEFTKMLDETGLGDNPTLIKLFAKVGEMTQEDRGGGNGGEGADRSFGRQMTPDSAQAEIQKLFADSEFQAKWMTEGNPGHDEAVARMKRLNELAYPQQRTG